MATTLKLGVPYPAATDAPDGPGAFLALANWIENHGTSAGVMTHLRYTSPTNLTVVPNGWTTVPMDTVVYDPLGLKPSSTGTLQNGITVPIAGRWSFFARVAVTVDDTAGRYVLAFLNSSSSLVMSSRGQYGIVADNPMEHYTEEIIGAGIVVVPQLYRSTTTSQWMRGNGSGSSNMAQLIARYLGPA